MNPFVRLAYLALGVATLVVLVGVSACAAPTAAPLNLAEGRFTPLGGVRVSDNPTQSDFADLQAAESGKLNLPAFVEFYADN